MPKKKKASVRKNKISCKHNTSESAASKVAEDKKSEVKQRLQIAAAVNQDLLFNAVFYGFVDKARLAIREGADVNVICGDYFTLIHRHTLLYIACYKGNSAIVQLLLDHKANVNQPIDDGSTPLFVACQRNHESIVQLLLNNGALVNVYDKDGESPLFVASGVGAIKVIDILLTNGANVNMRNNNARGATSLFIACQTGKAETVEFLLAKGADIHQLRNDGVSVQKIAAAFNHTHIVELLKKEENKVVASINLPDSKQTAIDKLVTQVRVVSLQDKTTDDKKAQIHSATTQSSLTAASQALLLVKNSAIFTEPEQITDISNNNNPIHNSVPSLNPK